MTSDDRKPTDSLAGELGTLIATQRERLEACEDLLRQLRIRIEEAPDAHTRETTEAKIQSVLSAQRRYETYLDVLAPASDS